MNISAVAKLTGLSAKTIRYYEKEGIIPLPERGSNGYRTYSQAQANGLLFIKRARSLGFSLSQSRELLDLFNRKDRCSSEVKEKAQVHLEQIENQIAALTEIKTRLTEAVEACAGDDNPECPILDQLSGKEVVEK